ncbi:MAG: UDP-N-acetylmuramoyl-L-alanyl-D-glutamate--2,6-diaminopimelate ligase [Tatlockia sp.]
MNFAELMRPWIHHAMPDCAISGIHNDSRFIKPGYLFLAYPGAATDGRLYIEQALAAGAVALVFDPENWSKIPDSIPAIALPELGKKLAGIASRFYGEPSKKMAVIGVTGTNGKTTIAYQLAQAQELLGKKAAYIGTIGQGEVNALKPLANTTPDALCLQHLLHDFNEASISTVCMEVSSHALCQGRVDEVRFQQAIFTNLSHEHLDYHHTMEDYAAAKATLFKWPQLKWAIINQDDPFSQRMIHDATCQILPYGFKEGALVRARQCEVTLEGTTIHLDSPWGQHRLVINALGLFNVYNALAVFSSLMVEGFPVESVIAVMAQLKAAPGRMEIVTKAPFTLVDYAHSPDALENVLITLKTLQTGRVIVVFGCGGDRDKSKRPVMGKIASAHADVVILTSDNPRTENPEAIIDEIEAGISEKLNLYKISDRKQAIQKALFLANKEDIILVAGKGHEDYQQIGTVRHAFSDQAVLRELVHSTCRA